MDQNKFWLVLILIMVTVVVLHAGEGEGEWPASSPKHRDPYNMYDYRNHSCRRPCEEGEPPKTCRYYFLLEHFTTMSSACYGCPDKDTDCFLSQCVPGDGNARGILTANRMVPGPSVYVCKGDTIEVMIDNRMELGEGTSIHWHGLRQTGTPHMDGTNLVTQCPVHTWSKMIYRYKALDTGTHFWHSHSSIQRSEGLFGGLVIRIPKSEDPHGHLYDYDLPEHYVVLSDWTKVSVAESYVQNFHNDIRTLPSSILINGLGSTEDGPVMPYPVFTVKPGKRYRFRFAYNGILNCPIYITIDDHPVLILATDGENVEPVEVDAFMILSGERYDFVLKAKQGVKDNFWIRFKGHGICVGRVFQAAILRYEGANNTQPEGEATNENTDEDEDERILNGRSGYSTEKSIQIVDLKALDSKQDEEILQSTPHKQFYVSMAASKLPDKRFKPPPPNPYVTTDEPPRIRPVNHQLNYISSRLPPSPPLSQFDEIPQDIFCNNDTVKKDCSKELCICVHKLEYNLGDLVEIVLVSFTNTVIHPMHMHGHSYKVVTQLTLDRDLTVDEIKAMDKRGEIPRRRHRAPQKDTIAAHAQAVTIIRFKADNPGFWFFHCHIEFHAEIGMNLILQEGRPKQMPKPPREFPTCQSWRSPKKPFGPKQRLAEETTPKDEDSESGDYSITFSATTGAVLLVSILSISGLLIAALVRQKQKSNVYKKLPPVEYESIGLE